MELDKGALDAWITREPGDTLARDEVVLEHVPDECPICDWTGAHEAGCPVASLDEAVDGAVEALLDAAARLMGFARSAQNDPALARGRAVEVLRDLQVKVDTSIQLARLETAR